MAKTFYRIVGHRAGSYAVEVRGLKNIKRVQSGFKSEVEAEAWATDQAVKSSVQWVRQPIPR